MVSSTRFLFIQQLRSTPSSSKTFGHQPLSWFAIYCYCSSSANNFKTATMETNSTDTKEPKRDRQSETCDNGACDLNHSKKVSDDILPHILNLYASRALPQDFEIYAPNASFEDPLMCARGVKQIKSAFYSLSKVFTESRIVEYSIKENMLPHGRREILIDNKQYYKFMGKNIDMISLIKLYVENGKVIRHEDCWDKKPLWNKETSKVPLVGQIIEMSKRASMFATHAMMRFGKDPTT
uniref:uncharacterized protein LOC122589003 n=1 Tax=Erigeron canadensis TaxID=72917 RepID=UPI001CB90759|nr:uncharacterized protein LOC122589003 [Erigeron canadensis]